MRTAYFTHGLTLDMTLEDARSASHQGRCDEDVAELVKDKAIARQLDAIGPEKLRAELKEYGAWDAAELADDDANRERIVWIAAGNIVEEAREKHPGLMRRNPSSGMYARVKDKSGRTGTVISRMHGDGTYDVEWDQGRVERVKYTLFRPIKNPSEYAKERTEHPTLGAKTIRRIVADHRRKLMHNPTFRFEGKTFDVYLVDDGTMDTVISIGGREFRFDGEYAASFRAKSGAMTEKGLRALAEEALGDMEQEEFDALANPHVRLADTRETDSKLWARVTPVSYDKTMDVLYHTRRGTGRPARRVTGVTSVMAFDNPKGAWRCKACGGDFASHAPSGDCPSHGNAKRHKKVFCPKCGEEIWDYAFGSKLNKCWSCKTAFDVGGPAKEALPGLRRLGARAPSWASLTFEQRKNILWSLGVGRSNPSVLETAAKLQYVSLGPVLRGKLKEAGIENPCHRRRNPAYDTPASIPVREIELWLDNDEGLYRWWRGSRMSKRAFIKEHKAELQKAIYGTIHRHDQPNPRLPRITSVGGTYEVRALDSTHVALRLVGTEKWGIPLHIMQLRPEDLDAIKALGILRQANPLDRRETAKLMRASAGYIRHSHHVQGRNQRHYHAGEAAGLAMAAGTFGTPRNKAVKRATQMVRRAHRRLDFDIIMGNPPGTVSIGRKCLCIVTSKGDLKGNFGAVLGLKDGTVLVKGFCQGPFGGRVKRVEYMDEAKAKREGMKNPGLPWRHDFTSTGATCRRVKGGVLLCGPKPLWGRR